MNALKLTLGEKNTDGESKFYEFKTEILCICFACPTSVSVHPIGPPQCGTVYHFLCVNVQPFAEHVSAAAEGLTDYLLQP